MKQLGSLLLVFGAGSFLLNLLGQEFTLIMWIDTWGRGVGIAIRLAMVGLGILFLVLGARRAAEVAQPAAPQPPKPPGRA